MNDDTEITLNRKIETDDFSLLDQILSEVPEHVTRRVSHAMAIAYRIHTLLEERGMGQRDLALKMGVAESAVSRWLTGAHNFTLETVSKIEVALGADILVRAEPPSAPVPEPHATPWLT